MFNSLRKRASFKRAGLEDHAFFSAYYEFSSFWGRKLSRGISRYGDPKEFASLSAELPGLLDKLEREFLDLKKSMSEKGFKVESKFLNPEEKQIQLFNKIKFLIFSLRDVLKTIPINLLLAVNNFEMAVSTYHQIVNFDLISDVKAMLSSKNDTSKGILKDTLLEITQDENETERLLKEEQNSWGRMRDNLIKEELPVRKAPVRKAPVPKVPKAPLLKAPLPKAPKTPVKKTPKVPSTKPITPRKTPIKLTPIELTIENEFSHLNSYLDFNNLTQPELMEVVLRLKPSMDKVIRNDEYAVYDKKLKPSVSKSGLLPVTLITQFTKTLKNLNTLYDLGDLEPIELITTINLLLPIFNKVPAFKITDKKAMWLGY